MAMFTIATMKEPEKGSLTEMREQVEELRHANAALQTETMMFERHISRLDPHALVPQAVPEHLDSVPSMHGNSRHTRESKVWRPSQDHSQLLTLEQKCAIAQREMEELKNDLENLSKSSERVGDSYKDTSTKRLCLKNTSQKHRQKLKLRQKKEVEKTFHKVDLQQLKIENSQYLEQVDKFSQDLQRVSLQGGKTMKVFNHKKKKLQSLTLESESLSSDIASREDMLMKIEEQTQQVEKERAKAESENKRLRTRLSEYRVPDVLSYVEAKASHTKLEQSIRSWERKVAIAEMELKTLTKAWNKHRGAAEVVLPPI